MQQQYTVWRIIHPNSSSMWTGGLSKRFNAKNLHISIVPCFCISVLQFTLHERSHNETIQKSSCLWQKRCSLLSKLRRWLLQTWKPWWLKALAAKLLSYSISTHSRNTRLNESFARLGLTLLSISWNIFCTLKLILKHFGMRLTTDMKF